MRKPWFWAALTASLSFAGASHADETGVEIGVRSGYAIALGKVADGDFNDFMTGHVPLWFDLGYRLTPNVMIGGYFVYGFGFKGDAIDAVCDAVTLDCTVKDVRVGAQVHYHFMPWQSADPWLGAGIGYEWATFSASAANMDGSLTYHGFEFLNLQGGLDLLPSDESNLGLGPFISFSIASAPNASCDIPGGFSEVCSGDIESSLHHWLTLGVRGTFVP
jgi:hypothetical protein